MPALGKGLYNLCTGLKGLGNVWKCMYVVGDISSDGFCADRNDTVSETVPSYFFKIKNLLFNFNMYYKIT